MKGLSGRKDIFQISHYFKIGDSDLEKFLITFFFLFFFFVENCGEWKREL